MFGRAELRGQGHALGRAEEQVRQADAVGIVRDDLVAVRTARRRLRHRRRVDHRRRVREGHREDAVRRVRAQTRLCPKRDGLRYRALARAQPAAADRAREIDEPQSDRGLGERHVGLAGEVLRRVDHERDRRDQVAVAGVRDPHVVRHRAGKPIRARCRERDRHPVGEVHQRSELRGIRRSERKALGALHGLRDAERVVVGNERLDVEQRRARRSVVPHAEYRGRGAVRARERVVGRVQHRGGVGRIAHEHVVVEAHRDGRDRQRRERGVGGRRARHQRRDQGTELVHLVRLRDQDAAVGGRAQHFAARAALGERHAVERGDVEHLQGRALDRIVGQVGRDEQQPREARAVPAEGDGIDLAVELRHRRGASAPVEFQERAALGPARAPQLALRRELQIVDAHVAEVLEAAGQLIEGLDAVARGDVQLAARRIDGEGLGDAVAEAPEHAAV